MVKQILLAVSLTLSGCAALEAAKWLSPASQGVSLDAELTVGDKQEEINTEVGNTNTKQTASTISNVYKTDPLLILLALLGWMLPSPQEMWRGFVKLLPWVAKE